MNRAQRRAAARRGETPSVTNTKNFSSRKNEDFSFRMIKGDPNDMEKLLIRYILENFDPDDEIMVIEEEDQTRIIPKSLYDRIQAGEHIELTSTRFSWSETPA